MSDYTALTRLQIAVRAVDRETFAAAAKARQQTLRRFLAETLSVVAADLRQPAAGSASDLARYLFQAPRTLAGIGGRRRPGATCASKALQSTPSLRRAFPQPLN